MAKRVSLKGKGSDLFFGDYAPEPPVDGRPEPGMGKRDGSMPADPVNDALTAANGVDPADEPRNGAEMPRAALEPRAEPTHLQASGRASKQASKNGETDVETIRKVVKTLGREVSFVRLTSEEKGALADVVYAYKRQGIKTTENEINRIAINALLIDYQAHGEASMLARVLAALRA